ncbi:hypothetical protein L227DRAFT_515173 [Lentinus tigrinus ALCF2SS1-6]|uniref:Uncharacterized protein n=1 Tax=Lentinus tigrinus ALCF2SS1-6 TaxID=1328759 RepID=A0A5C2RP40_9APHY|nr:hypothetical protein L227DRAFT_515173 [Lentinus tigrinus ALCF2SS1-6]
MSVSPLVVFQAYLEDGRPFDVHETSSAILTGMIRSRFIGRESALLLLNRQFHDLADRSLRTRLKADRNALEQFSHSRQSDLIMVINTHASPDDGGLLYGNKKSTSLVSFVDHLLGDLGSPSTMASRFSRSMLVVLCCGGFVQHSLSEMRAMSQRFTAVLAFGAHVLDPIFIMGQFVTSVVDYHIFGQESVWTAIYRALRQDIVSHTPIYVGHRGDVQRIVDASWRRKPNGDDVRCCHQMAKYVGTDRSGRITFRCCEPGHVGTRTIRITPMANLAGVRRFLGRRGGTRYMISHVL